MRGETGRANLFTRRAIIVGGAQALLTAGLAGRLYQLQVVDSERYQVLADENRINMQLLPPARGRIFDRFGQVLAENRLNYRLILVPEAALNLDKALDEIAQLGTGRRPRPRAGPARGQAQPEVRPPSRCART